MSRVVLIEKPAKSEHQEKTYRSICLIDSLGKLYEQLINIRLQEEIEAHGGLSAQQCGFRKGRSIMDAVKLVLEWSWKAHRSSPSEWCMVVAVDVKNAFNTADWSRTLNALRGKRVSPYLINVISDYLTDRGILIGARGSVREVNMGVPQGSILRPTLWNAMYDGLLNVRLSAGVRMVGYVDDVALVGQDRTWDTLATKLAEALNIVVNWLNENHLQLVPEKTEAIT